MREIEADFLSACMVSAENTICANESGVLGEWFDDQRNSDIFETLVKMSAERTWNIRNSVVVMQSENLFEQFPRALDLCSETPEWSVDPEEFKSSIDLIRSRFASRQVVLAATVAISKINSGEDPFNVADGMNAAVASVEESLPVVAKSTKDIAELALKMDMMVANGEPLGLPFPWFAFQHRTFGIPSKSVTPLAGRDGKGKSRLATFLAHSWAANGKPILYFPFEDGETRMISNMAATNGEYDMFTIRKGRVPDGFMQGHAQSLDQVSDMPLYIYESAETVERIVDVIAYHKRRYGITGVIIDGFKDIVLSKGENQTTKENHVMASLTRAATRHDVSIMPVMHLNKIEDDKWISKQMITGSGNQTKSARMVLVYQDAGFPEGLMAEYDNPETAIILECQKASYGDKGSVVLNPEFHKGQFTEIYKTDEME